MGKAESLIGKPAPPLELPSAPDGKLYKLPLGEKPIALFFFPNAFTLGCTAEACAFRDAQAENVTFKRHPNLEVVGVSHNRTEKQASFADEYKLPYTLLSDVDETATKTYQCGKWLFGSANSRVTFFIDHKGIVRGVCEKNVDVYGHTKFVEQQLKELEKEMAAQPTATTTAPIAEAQSVVAGTAA